MLNLRAKFNKDRNVYTAAQEPCIFHCHHYNTYLQAVIENTSSYLNVYPILINSAHEIVYDQFIKHFQIYNVTDIMKRKEVVENYFRYCGLGSIDLSNATENGGRVVAPFDHYGIGWRLKFGIRDQDQAGVSMFTNGFITGALEAIYDLPKGTLAGEQTACISKGANFSEFSIKRLENRKQLDNSLKEGEFQHGALKNCEESEVDYLFIREALTNMPLQGAKDSGLIDSFGVFITRICANYYCLISYRFLKLFQQEKGEQGLEIARELLTEAGNVCAFNTFGGVMQSVEWNALIKPMLSSKEDWLHGVMAVANSFGWGFWEIEELEPGKRMLVKITSGYEPNAYLKMYSKSDYPISFLATGSVAGLMNLVYKTSITNKFVMLDNELFSQIQAGSRFVGKQLKCRAMGDEYDLIEAKLCE